MGRLGQVETSAPTVENGDNGREVTSDLGGGEMITADQYGPPGDDSPPVYRDYVAHTSAEGEGEAAAGGFIDPENASEAEPGEKRLYSRDVDGTITGTKNGPCAVAWLRNDGSISLETPHIGTAGEVVAMVKLYNNGTIELITGDKVPGLFNTFFIERSGTIRGENQAGFFQLGGSGNFTVNGHLEVLP